MKLYSFSGSSTAYRVRIALNLKGLAYELIPVDLTKGEQRDVDYAKLNPIKGVPTLVTDDGDMLTQSMAILTYLDTIVPEPRILPSNPLKRAQIEAAAQIIAADIHPVNNLKVRKRLADMGHSQDEVIEWMNHWMLEGLTAFQSIIEESTPFSFDDAPSLVDICLIPQLYNAHRWKLDMSSLGRLLEIETHALAHPAFEAAHPDNQQDSQ